MDKNLTYQKARRIRGTKLTDLLADQLLYEPTIAKAIGKTISLKAQSSIKGIQAKFDPLNIVKFLTFGSKLGPALYGKLAGRDIRDIEYFTGRNRPLRVGPGKSTASKIGPVPGADGDIGGINQQLLKIYSYLKKSNEFDIKRREKEQNFAEEKELESKRRHKELLEALSKLGAKPTTTIVKKEGKEDKGIFGGLFDMMKNFVLSAIDKAMKAFEWIIGLKKYLQSFKLMTYLQLIETVSLIVENEKIQKRGLVLTYELPEPELRKINEELFYKANPYSTKFEPTDEFEVMLGGKIGRAHV